MKTTKLFLLLALSGTISACQTTVNHLQLDTSEWILTDWSRHVLPGDKLVTIVINQATDSDNKNNRLSGQGFCNRYSASFEQTGKNSIKVSPVISTRMACSPEKMEAENAYLAQIQTAEAIDVVSGRLVLTTADGKQLIYAPK